MAQSSNSDYKHDTVKPFPGRQLEARVPYEPTVFPSSQQFYLFCEAVPDELQFVTHTTSVLK